jgi:hypothetical protein
VIDGRERRCEMAVKTKKKPEPRWCPASLRKMQRRRLQKLHKSEIEKEREEKARDDWFNEVQPMIKTK